MKKLMSLTMIALLAAACQKEEAAPQTPGTAAQPTAGASKMIRYDSKTYSETATTAGCEKPPLNCLDEVTVTNRYTAAFTSVYDDVVSANDVKIQAAFMANRIMLLDYIDDIHVDGVIAGTFIARSNKSPGIGGQRFILIHKPTAGTPLVRAYGLKW